MSIAKKSISAVGKLIALGVLAAAFMTGLAGVVYMSLQGKEVQVPDITGKDLGEADKELALLGLKIKKRADRASQEKPGTVIEELPKHGDTVKTGQMIMVVTSRGPENGTTPPPATVKSGDEDDSDKIEEMIQTAMAAQELYGKAALVDHEALARHQSKAALVDAEECLKAAFATDVRPMIGEWRRSKGLAENPLQAFRASGYLEQAARERAERNHAPVSSYA